MASDQIEYCGECPRRVRCAEEIKNNKFQGCNPPGTSRANRDAGDRI